MRAFSAHETALQRARAAVRNTAIAGLSLGKSPTRTKGWVRFPYYHHVFDDERAGFRDHIRYFKNIGDIIGIDEAIELITNEGGIDGRYICITFDDGFKNWIENAVPILVDENTVAAFFVATGYIGTDIKADRERLLDFYEDGARLMEFLTWDDCRDMVSAGMTIGSHSVGHVHLADLDEDGARSELRESKAMIERETGAECLHFCCPFGRSGIDYQPDRHPDFAADAGYRSFLTGHRGSNRAGTSPFDIKRDHVLANWGTYQLRYFLSE